MNPDGLKALFDQSVPSDWAHYINHSVAFLYGDSQKLGGNLVASGRLIRSSQVGVYSHHNVTVPREVKVKTNALPVMMCFR
jgi:hypothetical protein